MPCRAFSNEWYVVCVAGSAVDCMLADGWQPWTACSSRCGLGTRRRARRIVRAASNGGRPCASTVQKGICYGTRCKFARAHGRVQMQGTFHHAAAAVLHFRLDTSTAVGLLPLLAQWSAFSALTLLAGRQEEHPACKNWVMRCWCDCLSGARCRLFEYSPADDIAFPKPHHLLPRLNLDWFCLSGTNLPTLSWKRGR